MKQFRVLVLLCVLPAMLTGCAGGPVVRERIPTVTPAPGEQTGAAPQSSDTQSSPGPVDMAAGGDAAPVQATTVPVVVDDRTILLYANKESDALPFLEQLAGEFGDATDWKAEIVPKDAGALRLDFEMAALAGQGPDVLWTTSEYLSPLVSASTLQPVTGYFTPTDFLEAPVGAANIDGTQWGVPITAGDHLLLLYNKNLLPAAPRTTDELLRLAKPEGVDFLLAYDQTDPLWIVPWLGGFGGRIFWDDGTPSLNTPEMENTLRFLKELRDKNIIPPGSDGAGAEALFREGKAAMLIDGDWAIDGYSQLVNLGVAPIPGVSATNRPATPFVSGSYLLVPATVDEQKLDGVRSFIQFMSSPAVQARFVTELRRLPARAETTRSVSIQEDPLLKPSLDAMLAGIPRPAYADLREVLDAIRPQLAAVLAGELEPNIATQEMQRAAEAVVADR